MIHFTYAYSFYYDHAVYCIRYHLGHHRAYAGKTTNIEEDIK